jgi:phosphatidylglycerol:prolipoprotein diacylglycerol transferase
MGPITIYWYGLFMVIGISSALFITLHLAQYYKILKTTVFDLAFWLIIGGIIGARFYDVLLNTDYYIERPLDILKIYQGGLAIHGAILGGLLVLWLFVKKLARLNKENVATTFWKFIALIVPGLALGQAIGRFGNYFNQELYGLPTNLPWGIPIDLINRDNDYISNIYFHPTFIYESFGNLLIFGFLIFLTIYWNKKQTLNFKKYVIISLSYFILYSILRFSLEFIKIDETPLFLSLRWPQFISLLIIIASALIYFITSSHEKNNSSH